MTKICTACSTEKEISQFHRDSRAKDGLCCHCKSCAIARSKKHHQENRDLILKKNRENYDPKKNAVMTKAFRESHKEHLSAYKKKWAERHPSYNKERYARDKDRIRARQKEYNLKRKDAKNIQARQYRKVNRKKVLKASQACTARRRKTDLSFRILDNLRTRLWWALNKNTKSARTIELLGCSIQYLRHHLEKQFTPGMTWKNYGKWEVDHRKPCASFDMTDNAQQRECFHWSNLQPLWKLDNILKSDSMTAQTPAAESAQTAPLAPAAAPSPCDPHSR